MKSLLIVLTLVSITSAYYQPCQPGTYFKKDCNTCVCSYEGRPVCTTSVCQSGFYNPGNSFKNPFGQGSQIKPSVSQIEIIPSQQIAESHSVSIQICTPNSFVYVNCNICRCSAFGDTYSCTQLKCAPTQPNFNVPGHQQYPHQNVPKYPVPNIPNNPPQASPTFPNINQQHNPQQGNPTFSVPNIPNHQQPTQNVPDQPHKHSHGCGHSHKSN